MKYCKVRFFSFELLIGVYEFGYSVLKCSKSNVVGWEVKGWSDNMEWKV